MSYDYISGKAAELAQSQTEFFLHGIELGEECVKAALSESSPSATDMPAARNLVDSLVETEEDRLRAMSRRLDKQELVQAVQAGVLVGADELFNKEVGLVAA